MDFSKKVRRGNVPYHNIRGVDRIEGIVVPRQTRRTTSLIRSTEHRIQVLKDRTTRGAYGCTRKIHDTSDAAIATDILCDVAIAALDVS